jgi:hypothetical protein
MLEGAGTLDQWFDPEECNPMGTLGVPLGLLKAQEFVPQQAQEFVPQLPILSGVILSLDGPAVGIIGAVFVHRDVIDGEILGAEDAVLTGSKKLRVNFTPAIAVTPGGRYVLALVGSPGWSFVDVRSGCTGYEAGSAIVAGMREPNFDFIFRTYGSTE